MQGGVRYAANCSLLFTEVPLLQRPAAAADAGFSAIEFWWPWPEQPVPSDAAVDAFVGAVADAGIQLIGLNFFAGDLAGADAGIVSLPDRVAEFRDNVDVVVDIGERLGVPAFNALYGVRIATASAQQQDEVADENLAYAAHAVDHIGATVLVEPVSGAKPYPLRTAADVVSVLDRVETGGAHNVWMLCDLFHLANNGNDLDAVIDDHADRIGHVQIADHPGRHQPGTGTLDFDHYLGRIAATGYPGRVALEYVPAGSTLDSLSWLPVEHRA